MATDEVMKNYFARFIGHEMMFMVFSSDFHGIFTNLSFIVKAKRHDQDSSSECDSSEDSRNNDQKQARKKTKKYKTRYSKEWEKTYPFLKACPTSVSEKEYKFHCSCCKSNLSCAEGGINDVAKHASKDWFLKILIRSKPSICLTYVSVKSKFQHAPTPPGIPLAFDTFAVLGRREFDYQSLPGGGEFDPHALGVGNLNYTHDFM